MLALREDFIRHLEQEEDEDCKTSQGIIGMNKLFCRHIVKDWMDININKDIHRILNKIIFRKHVEFYVECWKH